MKAINSTTWAQWDIDASKTVKSYDDSLQHNGWLYWGGSSLMLLSNN